MAPFMSFLRPGASIVDSSTSHITSAPPIARTPIGPAAEHLETQMVQLYWNGVRNELPHIILTLREWQQREEFARTTLPDETDLLIHGYDTFLDQVSHSSRRFGERHGKKWEAAREKQDKMESMARKHAARTGRSEKQKVKDGKREEELANDGLPTYSEALENRGWDIFAELKSNQIKEEVRERLEKRPTDDILRRRARMLLQSAQFLDIDKHIEHRQPEQLVPFWKRPPPPQLIISSIDDTGMPVFRPLHCTSCNGIVRGPTFRHLRDEATVLCESCYRRLDYGSNDFTKEYKTCCLPKAMTPRVSRGVCLCTRVRRIDNQGRPTALWPIENTLTHDPIRPGMLGCGLFELANLVAENKYGGTRIKGDRETTLEAGRLARRLRPKALKDVDSVEAPEFGASCGLTKEQAEDVPFYVRSVAEEYPFGGVHMALRFGPLVIETGVENTHGGVLITTRNPPHLQVPSDATPTGENSLLLTGKTDRKLYSQQRPKTTRRYKAMMKQVVGGAFSTLFNDEAETDVIDTFIMESQTVVEKGLGTPEKSESLHQSVERLVGKLKKYLGSRVDAYICSIVGRLLDPEVDIRWNFKTNNCQMFCDSIIDRAVFGSFIPPHEDSKEKGDHATTPLYSMSFVCRPGAYVKQTTKSKFDVPNSLTEEYLLKLQYGRHEESDIIDSLVEYWHDWGNFEGTLYPYQDVFPWDCTEAYCRYPGKCGECNISKHVLAFPFDSWSIISLHLSRGRELYPREDGPLTTLYSPGQMSDTSWFKNRTTVLLAQDTLLTTAVAMSRTSAFRESTLWLHSQADETQDRLKLGGIHRAQPFSHHFERGAYHLYFVAEWTSLTREMRVRAYEEMRDRRAARADVGSREGPEGTDGGCVLMPDVVDAVVVEDEADVEDEVYQG